jgi:pilus assembly protein Flp/PilA
MDYWEKVDEVMRMLFLKDETGQGLVEYGLVLILVAVVIIVVLTLLGPQIGNMFSRISMCIPPTPLCG